MKKWFYEHGVLIGRNNGLVYYGERKARHVSENVSLGKEFLLLKKVADYDRHIPLFAVDGVV
jgi:hypothetical protein